MLQIKVLQAHTGYWTYIVTDDDGNSGAGNGNFVDRDSALEDIFKKFGDVDQYVLYVDGETTNTPMPAPPASFAVGSASENGDPVAQGMVPPAE